MRNIVGFFIKHPIWTNAIIVLTLLIGLYGYINLNKSFFPEISPNRIQINVMYPGASPEEIEKGVTKKIEQSLEGIKDIEEIESTSSENFTTIEIEADPDADMKELLGEVENAVNSISDFPPNAEKPQIFERKAMGMASIVGWIVLHSDAPLEELKQRAEEIKDDFLSSPYISQVNVGGFPDQIISIEVKEENLLRYGITMDEISNAVKMSNIDLSGGQIKGSAEEMMIRVKSKTTDASKISNTILRATQDGQVIRIKDVADVTFKFSETSQKSFYKGRRSVVFTVQKQPEEDIAAISKFIDEYVAEYNEEHDDMNLNIMFMFNEMLSDRINLLAENGMIGLLLVLITLGLFLNIRLSAWVAFGIPFSFLGMFILGLQYGMTINMISLFGMILVVGILVDDGIVIAENIYAHYEKGKSSYQAALDGTMEVIGSVFTSVITTMVAFSMLFFVEGDNIMMEMAFVVIACLGFSLIEAFFILPSHLASEAVLSKNKEYRMGVILGLILTVLGLVVLGIGFMMMIQSFESETSNEEFYGALVAMLLGVLVFFIGYGNSPVEEKVRVFVDKVLNTIRNGYFGDMLSWVVKHYRFAVFVPLIFIIVVQSLWSNGNIESTLFPDIKFDSFNVEVAFKPGEREDVTEAFLRECHQIVDEVNQEYIDKTKDTLITYSTIEIGYTENLGVTGPNAGLIRVSLDVEGKSTPSDEIAEKIRKRVMKLDGARLAEDIYIGGDNQWGKPIEMALSSEDIDALREAQKYLRERLERMPELVNVKDNSEPGNNEIVLKLLPEARMQNLTLTDIARQVRQGFFGEETQRLIIGMDEVKVWVRYPQEDRSTLGQLEKMKIKTMTGQEIPLQMLASYDIERGEKSINRTNGQREVIVDADQKDRDASTTDIIEKIQDNIVPDLEARFPDVDVTFKGQFEAGMESIWSLVLLGCIVLILMLVIISLNFNSVYQGLLVVLTIPAGVYGAYLGHGIVGIPISSLSGFGIVALLGVLINDSVVFLDQYNRNLKNGEDVKTAAYNAAISRFRPIILTSITTVVGLMPLISETSFQAQFLIPMAVSIAYGILFGTLFIVLFFPAAILFGTDVRRAFRWWWSSDVNVFKGFGVLIASTTVSLVSPILFLFGQYNKTISSLWVNYNTPHPLDVEPTIKQIKKIKRMNLDAVNFDSVITHEEKIDRKRLD
jgi:multidrug efflux pump subunit AcrB